MNATHLGSIFTEIIVNNLSNYKKVINNLNINNNINNNVSNTSNTLAATLPVNNDFNNNLDFNFL